MKQDKPLNAVELRRRAETLFSERQDRQQREGREESGVDPLRLVHELEVHQIELELQNEELQQARAEVEAGLQGYTDLYDFAPVGYCTVSAQGLILKANFAAATLLGVARGELVMQPISRFIAPEDSRAFNRHCRQLITSGEPQVIESWLTRQDGGRLLARLDLTAGPEECGAPVCWVTMIDITASKQMAADLQENATTLTAIFAAATESILIIKPEGTIMAVNREAAAILGRSSKELIGLSLYQLLPPALAVVRKARINMAFKSQTAITFQEEWNSRQYSQTVYPVVDAAGRWVRAIIFGQDVTERVVAERIIRQSKDDLEQQVRERTAALEGSMAALRLEVDAHVKTMADLHTRESELKKLTEALLAANAGLAALLRLRDQEKEGLRDEVLAAIKKLVMPSLERLNRSGLTERQQRHLQTVEANLGGIVLPLGREPLAISAALTKMEMQVANFIKQGKKTKEIAGLLDISPRTVETHRNNVRKKLRIPGRKITLRNYLLSFS